MKSRQLHVSLKLHIVSLTNIGQFGNAACQPLIVGNHHTFFRRFTQTTRSQTSMGKSNAGYQTRHGPLSEHIEAASDRYSSTFTHRSSPNTGMDIERTFDSFDANIRSNANHIKS